MEKRPCYFGGCDIPTVLHVAGVTRDGEKVELPVCDDHYVTMTPGEKARRKEADR